jgi:hypothetical protein
MELTKLTEGAYVGFVGLVPGVISIFGLMSVPRPGFTCCVLNSLPEPMQGQEHVDGRFGPAPIHVTDINAAVGESLQ